MFDKFWQNALLIIGIIVVAAGVAQCVKAETGYKSVEQRIHEQVVRQKHREMLYTVVLVRGKGGTGSGTVVMSGGVDDEVHSYVLTNHHVVRGNITVENVYDPKVGKKIDREKRTEVELTWFVYNEFSRMIGSTSKRADIVAYDDRLDLALLKLRDTERLVPHVATLIPENAPIHLFDVIYAVGSGLGEPPFATQGEISFLDKLIDGERYLLSSAPIIFGNSGGSLFRYSEERERYEMIGVPSKVSSAGYFSAVSHMAWSIPMETVRGFLRDNCYMVVLAEDLGDGCEAAGKIQMEESG